MAFVTEYGPDPRTLGAYAYQGAAGRAQRENLQRSIDNAMQAAQVSGQFAQNNRQMAMQAEDRRQQRDAVLQQELMQQQGYARKGQVDVEQELINADTRLQIERMRQQGEQRSAFNERVQQGLKDGTMRYSPQDKQLHSELQRRIIAIDGDPSIAPDQKEEMVRLLQGRLDRIIPQVVPESDRPVPFYQQAAEQVAVQTKDGRVIPLGQLGRGLEDGEVLITGTMRNGSMSFTPKPFAAKAQDDPWADFTNPIKLNQIRSRVASDIKSELDVQHDNELADWEMKKEAHKKAATSDEPFTVPRPRKRLPTPQEIDVRLYEISGGVAGRSAEQIGREFFETTAAPAIRGFLERNLPQQPIVVASEQEAMQLPVGTKIILNGRLGTVGQ